MCKTPTIDRFDATDLWFEGKRLVNGLVDGKKFCLKTHEGTFEDFYFHDGKTMIDDYPGLEDDVRIRVLELYDDYMNQIGKP